MTTKIEAINSAYSQIRISGLTVQPTPEDVSTALWRLEDMMAELEDTRNICVGYNFEEAPDPNSETGVKRGYQHMIATNLGIRLIPDFNKQVPQTLMAQASQAMSGVSGAVAAENIRQVQYPNRMPRGSGSTQRFNRWQRFYREAALPTNDCESNYMAVGDINDYQESFSAYLAGETIASFTIEVSDGLDLISSSNTDDVVSYRIEAKDNATTGIFQTVDITITTGSGRINLRTIEFGISS